MSQLHFSTDDPGALQLTCQNCGKHREVPVHILRPGDKVLCLLCGYTLAAVQAEIR